MVIMPVRQRIASRRVSGTLVACPLGMSESETFSNPFGVCVQHTPTGAAILRQPTSGDDIVIYVPPAQVRYLALELARIAAERVG